MRILRVLPLAVGLAVAVIAPVTPASADTVFGFSESTNYRDSISVNHWARRSDLGSTQREESRERAARTTRDDDDEVEQAYEAPRARRRGARGQRVASLGSSGSEAGWSGGGSHGMASFYWQPQRVASGGWFNPNAMTAAHKTLPFGTRVRVTHLGNGRSVVVRINDRGPYIRGRIIDLSKAAAGVIGMQGQGVARIRMDVIGR